MELILNIIVIIGLIILAAVSWQCWQILKKGRDDEKLSEEEVKAFSTRLTVIKACLWGEAAIMIIRLFLPLFD